MPSGKGVEVIFIFILKIEKEKRKKSQRVPDHDKKTKHSLGTQRKCRHVITLQKKKKKNTS